MRPSLTILLSILFLCGEASGQGYSILPNPTVGAVLPGCRALVEAEEAPTSSEAAFCSGTIDTLLYLGELLPYDYRYCVPLAVPRHQVINEIVNELNAIYPLVEKQHFKGLVLAILHYKWPCRGSGD